MARYVDEYQGIHGDMHRTDGADPNYRGGLYRGTRMFMRGGDASGTAPAAYGHYRLRHADDLGEMGGFRGLQRIDVIGDGQRRLGRPGYDYGMRDTGGVRSDDDPGFLRQFNAHSPALRGRGWAERRVENFSRGAGQPVPRSDTYRFGYTDRGLNEAGYTEPWVRPPMRGSRER